MKTFIGRIAILATVILISACAGPGARTEIPVSMPDGEKMTIVAHKQTVPDWMLDRDNLALNYVIMGEMSAKQLAAVAEAERACRLYAGTVRPSNLVNVMSQGALYALAGYVGVGIGSQAFAGAIKGQYAKYGAWATGTAGLANGAVTIAGQTYTFENCGREILPSHYGVRVLQKSPY